ncbi:MAG: transglutaminase domain-containing protein [Oscillospiraceae bacterium]
MKKLNFSFSTKLTFDNYVHDHSFALRCLPIESPSQHIVSCELTVSPFVSTQNTVDAFGNNVTTGYLKADHRFLDFEVKGTADIDCSAVKTDHMPCYLYQSAMTKPDESLKALYKEISESCSASSPFERAMFFSDVINEVMTYTKNVTDINTTASQAFEKKQGVCQDFSHIMLSLLRMDGIACRYIAGLASCDGETHSWVELWNEDHWTGIDPTNNCEISDNYLILSQGRDFRDCAVDRGVMFGAYTKQLQLIMSALV